MSLKFECDRCGFQDEAPTTGKTPVGWQILNGTAIWMRDTYLCPSCWKHFQVWVESGTAETKDPVKDPGAAAAADMLADIQRKMSQQTVKGSAADVSVTIDAVKLLNPRDPAWGAKFFKNGKWQQYVTFTVDEPEVDA